MHRLSDRSIEWLTDQTADCIRGFNGKAFDAAVQELIDKRHDEGHRIVRIRRTNIIHNEEEDGGDVEVIPYGGKGGSIRIVHPK